MSELEQNTSVKISLASRFENFLGDKYNLMFIGILIFALFVRLYFVFLTRTQPLWWDEAEYFNIAKVWAFHIPWDINVQRPPLFPLLVAGIFKLGLGDLTAKFLLVVLPSLGIVAITYFLARDLYNKKVALLASAIMSVFWLLLFNTVRNHTDALAMFLGAFGVYLFWKGYVEKTNKTMILLSAIILGLAFLVRLLSAMNIIVLLLFLIFTKHHKFVLDKNLWLAAAAGILTIVPYFIWTKIKYGSAAAQVAAYSSALTGITNKIAWHVFGFFNWYLLWIFLILFVVGLGLLLFDLAAGSDLFGKKEGREVNADLLMLLWVVSYVFYFVFVVRDVSTEDRWLLPMAIPLFIIAGKGIVFIFDQIKKYERRAAFAVVIILLLAGGYMQLARAEDTIISKAKTYSQEPFAGAWLKENTQPGDVIFSVNEQAPLTYYTNLKVVGFGENEQDTINKIKKLRPKYLVVTAYFPSPQWMFELPNKYDNIRPVQVFFEDAAKTQASIAIYEVIDYDNFRPKQVSPAVQNTTS